MELGFQPLHRKRLNNNAKKGKLYQIMIEKDAEFKPNQYNNLFDSLHSLYSSTKPWEWLTFEFHGTTKGISIYMWGSPKVTQEFLQSNINSIHPYADVYEVKADSKHKDPSISNKDYAVHFLEKSPYNFACGRLQLEFHYMFNLLQSTGERIGADMMASMCASMQNLADTEEVAIQFTLRPIDMAQSSILSSQYEIYQKTGRRPPKLHLPYSDYQGYLSTSQALLESLKYAILGTAGSKDVSSTVSSIRKKVEEGCFYDTNIRVIVYHPNFSKAKSRLDTVASAFAPATDKNRFRMYRNYQELTKPKWNKIFNPKGITKFLNEYAGRKIPTYPTENYLSPSELATVLHFPSKNVPNINRQKAKKLAVPDGIFQYNSVKEAWEDNAIVFGVSNYRGKIKFLAFKDIKMLMQHLYCIGGTGSGKSYWLSFLALQLVKHCGFTFFDVKGDVADEILARIPRSEWHRVHYIDLQDMVHFMPLNLLQQEGMSVYNLATMIVSVFIKLNSEGSIKEHSQSILRRALIAVISTNPEGSILEVYRMFNDEDYLDWTIEQMENGTDYPDVLSYWQNYKGMKIKARQSECSAILNKLEIITQNELPRYTLCQKENVLNWRKLMDEKSIIIVNYAMDKNEKEIIAFFGTLFTAFISKAVFSRGDIRPEDRVPHMLFLDEFEMFVQQQADMQRFLELSRSYGLGLILAHQSVEQIPDNLMGMISDNTFTQISLLIGDKSSSKIKKMFPGVDEEDLTSMLQYTGYARLKKLNPMPFTFESLDMNDYFRSDGLQSVSQFKDSYKRRFYKQMKDIRGDIQERYEMMQKNQITEDPIVKVKKGKASGKISRKGEKESLLITQG